jgi:cephalosporin hydroxylase
VPRFTIEGDLVRVGRASLRIAPAGHGWDAFAHKDEAILLLDKGPQLLAELHTLFDSRRFEAKRMFELGMWDGGSVVFWHEYFRPEKHVAVDHLDREDAPELRAYISEHGRGDRLRTFWRTDQADRDRLAEIAAAEFNEPLDLVIDDASHELTATRASFETLYPLLRGGGLYVIEDWNWEIYPMFRTSDHPWRDREGLVSFVRELVDQAATGRLRMVISQLFVAIERVQ